MYLKYAKKNTRHVTLHFMLELNQCNTAIWFKRCVTDSLNIEMKPFKKLGIEP